MMPEQIICEFHVNGDKSQDMNSKGSFYSAVNQREDTQIAGPSVEGGGGVIP